MNLPPLVKETRRRIDAVGLAVCLALTALLYVVGVHPIMEQRRAQHAQALRLAEERDEVAELTRSLSEVRQSYVTTQRAVANNALRLEPLSALNRRVAEVAATARSSGLEVERIRPGHPAVSEHYRTVPLHFTGRGSFHAGTTFLHQLHHDLPDVGLWSLQLEGRAGVGGADPTFQLELIWYAAPPAKTE
ncbi:MAG: type 4a pilus biogenesis protein PilO [Phycisphaeraceae bacterium]